MSDTITLISPTANLVVTLEPPVEVHDRFGSRIAERGKRLQFRQGRCRVTKEELELVKQTPAFTGVGGTRRVFLADEVLPTGGRRPQIISGAQGTGHRRVMLDEKPTEDWDEVGAVKLAKRIAEGADPIDLEAALAYELSPQGQRRKAVARALTDRLLEEPGDEDLVNVDGELNQNQLDEPPEVAVGADTEGL